jgi:hypothetical protein
LEFKKTNLIHVISILFFIRILIPGLSFAECLGALVVLSAIHLDRVLSYLFPKQVDVYKELSLVQSKLVEITSKSDGLERDVTALKMRGMRQ